LGEDMHNNASHKRAKYPRNESPFHHGATIYHNNSTTTLTTDPEDSEL
jgi:hypothetical protein